MQSMYVFLDITKIADFCLKMLMLSDFKSVSRDLYVC